MPNADSSLFDDPDEVLRHGSPDQRVDMLRRAALLGFAMAGSPKTAS
jgi:hypothetical protein